MKTARTKFYFQKPASLAESIVENGFDPRTLAPEIKNCEAGMTLRSFMPERDRPDAGCRVVELTLPVGYNLPPAPGKKVGVFFPFGEIIKILLDYHEKAGAPCDIFFSFEDLGRCGRRLLPE